jgi:DNA-binding transcriptional LysR family regulator
LKLRQLDALRAVAESGSLREAARRLYLTQPAISRSIHELEIELGLPLLMRTSRGATLTPFALQVLKRALVVQREVNRILEDAQGSRGELGGKLTLAITPPATTRACADALLELMDDRPGVKLEVIEWRTENIADGLRDGTVDIGIFTRYSEPRTTAYEWTRLYELDALLTISASYTGPEILSIEQLHTMPWMLMDSPGDESSFVATLFGKHGLPVPERTTRCSAMNLYLDLAMRVEAVAVWTSVAMPVLSQYVQDGKLKLLKLREPLPRIGMYLAYSSEDLLTVSAQHFIRCLQGKLARGDAGRLPAGVAHFTTDD